MAALTLYYADIKDAYQAAESAAEKSADYAEELTKKVTKKLGSLSGGSTSFTENAAYYTKVKISQLNERADRYNSYHDQLESFLSEAKETDSRVASSMRNKGTIKKTETKWSFSTPLEKALDSLDTIKSGFKRLCAYAEVSVTSWTEDVNDWYNTGNHKYYVNIGLAAAGIAAAGFTLAAAIPAALYAAGAFATGVVGTSAATSIAAGAVSLGVQTVVATASVISSYITLGNGFARLYNNIAAAVVSASDEVAAEEFSEISGMSSTLRSAYEDGSAMDSFTESVATGIDVTSIIASAITAFGSIYNQTYELLDEETYASITGAADNALTDTDKTVQNIQKVISESSKYGGYVQNITEDGVQETAKKYLTDYLKKNTILYGNISSFYTQFDSLAQGYSDWQDIVNSASAAGQ